MQKLIVAVTALALYAGLFGTPALAASLQLHRASAFGLPDADGDALPDAWETAIYLTDSTDADSDHDGYDDLTEILATHNPQGQGAWTPGDADKDGLNDRLEILFGTDPTNPDLDADGFLDGDEVKRGFSPTSTSVVPLVKELVITLSKQVLDQRLGGVTVVSHKVSTGKRSTPTPVGQFRILEKLPRRWSNHAKLWMPWWMEFQASQGYGVHELPEWPNGTKEGAGHLGIPVSGGCIRLGIGPAKALYDWTPLGTAVRIIR